MVQTLSPNVSRSASRAGSAERSPRLILVDDNIRDQGGHYFELANLLLTGAEQLGYRGVLATHRDFRQTQIVGRSWDVHRVFSTRRLVRWSLGVDGNSRCQRDLSGNPIGGSPIQNLTSRIMDRLGPATKRPTRMLKQWSDDFCQLLGTVRPTPADCLLLNTGDDFALLALANAMNRLDLPSLRIDVLFHFALHESHQSDRVERMGHLTRQIQAAMNSLSHHHVCLHATTDALAEQLREVESGHSVRSIPYPTRPCELSSGSPNEPLTAVIAGMPRAEKGKDAISDLLAGMEDSLLRPGRYRLSIQLPADRWRSMVPTSLHRNCEESMPGESMRALEIITTHLSTEDYHRWLSTADVGLFLYDPTRYVARCSGVLLEMMARGVPVIVPDHCWLASQVRQAGGHRSIGFIYQDRSEIPDLMRQFAQRRHEILPRSKAYAATVAKRHDGRNALVAMGIQPAGQRQHAA